jgi:hypothetical protein
MNIASRTQAHASSNPLETFNPYEITTTGTTICAIRYSKGVILACDTRTARGIFISDRCSLKANMISPDPSRHGHIMVLRAGVASHTQVIAKYVRNYLAYHAMELQDSTIGMYCICSAVFGSSLIKFTPSTRTSTLELIERPEDSWTSLQKHHL